MRTMSDRSGRACERRGFGPIGKRVLRSAGGRAVAAFTLIELLVVITVVVLLMAILVPALQRVRRQAGAVVCQSNLRQWDLIYSAYTHDYDGRFWRTYEPVTNRPNWWVGMLRPYCEDSNDLLICPLAATADAAAPQSAWNADEFGDTGGVFSAWRLYYYRALGEGPLLTGSYGHNHFVMDNSPDPRCLSYANPASYYWQARPAKGQAMIPLLADAPWAEIMEADPNCPPPSSESICELGSNVFDVCINRHDGYVNGLFMDSSVRKIGLKELWTLKWHRQFNTAGAWTTAGGVRPDNWPKWIRGFKDY